MVKENGLAKSGNIGYVCDKTDGLVPLCTAEVDDLTTSPLMVTTLSICICSSFINAILAVSSVAARSTQFVVPCCSCLVSRMG